jgi:hypothetical protein
MQATFEITPGSEFPTFTVQYVEPSKNTDGTPITNLAYCSMLYSIDGRVTEAAKVSALSPTGGGNGSWIGYVAVQDNTAKDVLIWATATNLAGLTSDSSVVVTIHVDRTHAIPMPPS